MRFPKIAGLMLILTGFPFAQKRCDLMPKATPGGSATCLDLVALKTSGATLQTAQNATRISKDGFTFCKNAFQMSSGAQADITFIYDNSGSMNANFVYVNPTTNDMQFYSYTNCPLAVPAATVTIQTLEGPRNVPKLASNTGCTSSPAGDPYMARGAAIREGINVLAASSPSSTASAVGFTDKSAPLSHQRPPVQLNTAGNITLVTKSVVPDSTDGGTYYGAPLRQATLWLTDTALTRAVKQAIVFISDGAPQDTVLGNNYITSIPSGIPIFSIFMGDTTTDYAKLKDLSTRTNGTFYLVNPNDVKRMNTVIQEIIRAITITAAPQSIEVSNLSLKPNQVSRSASIVRTGSDSSFSVVLDSILGLKQGVNDILVKLIKSDSLTDNYSFKVQADGPAAGQSSASLACYDPPTLAMLTAANQVDSIYSQGTSSYNIRLTRSPSELAGTTLTAITQDAAKGNTAVDSEGVFLPLTLNGVGVTTNQRNDYPLLASSLPSVKNNGTLEAVLNGKVVLTWSHPRDARETATFILPAKKVPTVPGFIKVDRVVSVAKGLNITEAITNPVVIRGGASLKHITLDSSTITTVGCIYNCTDKAIRLSDPLQAPSFVFKTSAPFSFTLNVFNNLGQFVMKSKGTVSPTEWQAMPKIGDSVMVAMSIIPVADNGQQFSTGVYIISATIKTIELAGNDASFPTKTAAAIRAFYNKFGYIRSPLH